MGRRSGACSRGSKKSILFYTTDCGGTEDDKDNDIGSLQQRSVSLTALHSPSTGFPPQQLLEPRMAQLETLEAKMASIEVSLSTTPKRKKGGSLSGAMTSPAGHKNRDYYKEVDALRVALRDKENIIQTLKGQLCNTLSNRLALRNTKTPPLTEADKKATEERLQKLGRDADNKRLAIKNLKLALERLDITDNIDIRIQQAELEYRLGREELELLTLIEEIRALDAALELAETQEKQKNDTIFSCITGGTHMTIHAVTVSADPKSPRFGAGPRDNAPGLYVDWAVEDSGLCKEDRILEVNGKLVVGAGKSDLSRLLAVTPEAAHIVVLRKSESLMALRALRSENLRLTHRISYLEEQVRDLLSPVRTKIQLDPTPPLPPSATYQDHVQVFQKGPQVTTLVTNIPNLNVKSSRESCQSLPVVVKSRHSDYTQRLSTVVDPPSKSFKDFELSSKLRGREKSKALNFLQLTRSTASLDCGKSKVAYRFQSQRRRSSKLDELTIKHPHNGININDRQQSLEFDSEPTYYHSMKDSRRRLSEYAEEIYTLHETNKRPVPPPKKPLRLSLHRATSLQSVESAPPSTMTIEVMSNSMKQSHNDRISQEKNEKSDSSNEKNGNQQLNDQSLSPRRRRRRKQSPPPPPIPRTPSRAESCQSALHCRASPIKFRY
ncbi:uncharacterized protein sprt [Chelonus insularis]|uniref:uncharacterized protein sprt n=1 Tax=Chelonus insularis TaxID=460826 RepID=UPI00158E82A4|nr:uncharacterized protein LOC118068635 [Chelonus insularis]XP_034942065.1 uncharacterized protein LOC118068635 [Chelonus insularis]